MRSWIALLALWLVLAGASVATPEDLDFAALARRQDETIRVKGRVTALAEARESFKAEPSLANRLLLGRLLPAREAVGILEVAVREAPGLVDARVLLARAYLGSGKARNADKEARTLVESFPGDPRGHHLLGMTTEALGKGSIAERFYREALAIDPNRAETLVALALLLHRLDRSEEGLDLLVKATSVDKPDAEALMGLGDLHVARGEIAPAIEVYTKIMGDDAWRPRALARRGHAELKANDLEKAYRDLTQAVQLDPRNYEARYWSGIALEWQGKIVDAREVYEKAKELEPDRPEVPTRLAWIAHKEGDNKGAAKDLGKVTDDYPDYLPAHFLLATVLFTQGDMNGARKSYSDVLRLDRNHYESYVNLARVALLLGKDPDALRYAKTATDLRPKSAEAITVLGQVYLEMKKYDTARDTLLVALDVDPRHAPAYRTMGEVYEAQGSNEEAITNYERAVSLDAKDPFTRYLLGMLYYELGDDENAILHLTAYLDLKGGSDKEVEAVVKQLQGG